MKENTNKMAVILEKYFGSQMFIEDGHILFSPPAKALIATLFGNPDLYKRASLMMQSAVYEQRFMELVGND